MISNYLKLAWRILGRRKFFTFISLFGISFTLGILMVVLSFLNSELGSNKPLTYKEDMVLLPSIKLRKTYYDTIPTIDTIYQNGIEVYDTTYQYENAGSGESNSSFNAHILEDHFKDLPSVEIMTIYNYNNQSDVYVNGVKLSLDIMYADPAYWSVMDFELLDGRFFDDNDMETAAKVIVMSDKSAKDYFGTSEGVVGEEFIFEEKTYQVIGVYPFNGKVVGFISPDAVIPYSNMDLAMQNSFYFGPFNSVFKKKSEASHELLMDEIKAVASQIPLDHPDNKYNYDEVILTPMSYYENFARGIYWDSDPSKSLRIMKWVLISLLLFFTILPTLNLINLNVSRIMERSSEIGVRKAFGAHRGNVVTQFIIENVVQTLIGGILGLALALGLIALINNGGYLGSASLQLSPKFYLYALLITLIFGVLSGLLPALRMSNLQIVNALKDGKI